MRNRLPILEGRRWFAAAAVGDGVDLFRFSDTPIFERLAQDRMRIGE